MKKKLLALVLTLAMALSLAACGGGDAPADSGTNDVPPAETQEPAAPADSGGVAPPAKSIRSASASWPPPGPGRRHPGLY